MKSERLRDGTFLPEGVTSADFRFTVSIEGLGARDVAADNAEALSEAFERKHPEVGAAIGASLKEGLLEAIYSVSAFSFRGAVRKGTRIFIDAATDSGLQPPPQRWRLMVEHGPNR
jgi:hypothetical protein